MRLNNENRYEINLKTQLSCGRFPLGKYWCKSWGASRYYFNMYKMQYRKNMQRHRIFTRKRPLQVSKIVKSRDQRMCIFDNFFFPQRSAKILARRFVRISPLVRLFFFLLAYCSGRNKIIKSTEGQKFLINPSFLTVLEKYFRYRATFTYTWYKDRTRTYTWKSEEVHVLNVKVSGQKFVVGVSSPNYWCRALASFILWCRTPRNNVVNGYWIINGHHISTENSFFTSPSVNNKVCGYIRCAKNYHASRKNRMFHVYPRWPTKIQNRKMRGGAPKEDSREVKLQGANRQLGQIASAAGKFLAN